MINTAGMQNVLTHVPAQLCFQNHSRNLCRRVSDAAGEALGERAWRTAVAAIA